MSAAPVFASTAAPSPLNPAAGWATSYLLSTAFAAEYDALTPALAGLSPTAKREALRSPPARALWSRARFALAAMQAKGQTFPAAAALAPRLKEHEAVLAGAEGDVKTLDRAAESGLLNQQDQAVLAGFQLVSGSFAAAPARQRWEALQHAYVLPSPTCPIDYREVKAFAEHQKRLTGSDRGGSSPVALLQPLAGWPLAKVQCLVFTLMAAPEEAKATGGFEPLHVLRALQQTGSPMARDQSLSTLLAVRYLQLGHYAETLATLMDLASLDEAYRLPYELVQRVYSMRQKGDGSVALQGM